MPQPINNREIYPLFLKLLENCISDQELQRLDELFSTHPELIDRYCEFGMNYAAMQMKLNDEVNVNEAGAPQDSFDSRLWSELVQHEKTAPHIESQHEEPKRHPVEKVVYEKVPSKVNKFSLAAAISCAAALLFLLFFIHFNDLLSGPEVATLTDSLNTRWTQANGSMQKGDRLSVARKPLVLQEGLVEMQFDNNVRVVVEAPAEFQIQAEDRVSLRYGQIYAAVPQQAIGFSIYTGNAKIIDLGTEFGVSVDALGETYLHMIKGETRLIAGGEADTVSMEVCEGTAKKVSGPDGEVTDIPCDQMKFARSIHPTRKIAWRGEPLQLASLIAGGNGFEPVFERHSLNPNTGDYEVKPLVSIEEKSNSAYNRVADNVFIDGVFVPDGSSGPVTITSQGHIFDCPPTSGKINRNIAVFYQSYDRPFSDTQPALFDGSVYGSKELPCVLLHSNVGITIDLDSIRESCPGQTIQQLKTGYGLTWAEKKGIADFFILVDGSLMHEDRDLPSREHSQSATINLGPNARFLTFVVTESRKDSASTEGSFDYDFFYLLNPRLSLE